MARTLLYLVRHGEQDPAGVEADTGLCSLGVEQAHRLGRRLAAVDFAQIHHSPLARAAQTSEVLAHHLPRVPRHVCDMVADRTPAPSPARQGDYPARWLPWLDNVPEQERDEDAADLRGAVAHFGAVGEEDRSELLVTHNFVIGWFVSHALRAPMWSWMNLDSANCGLTTVRWENGQAPKLVAFNDTGHL
ncbi:histidine phosphatase family protein [Kineococcus sp. R8]|uniref:histidine phosphatase family protein n=1 Tax=Kineococcus siccus TaxID=2696567 RepID=UPI001411FB8F|nr:histidine phosphatase family protein [Kineococcus siccus]NAZ81549.1 histidine phosphatase family protein [Kineococcus siccus]